MYLINIQSTLKPLGNTSNSDFYDFRPITKSSIQYAYLKLFSIYCFFFTTCNSFNVCDPFIVVISCGENNEGMIY